MKKLVITCILVTGMLLPLSFSAQAEEHWGHEHHPEIHEALHALEVARRRMEHAKHDFGGHREAALRACDAAIEQLRLALQYDR